RVGRAGAEGAVPAVGVINKLPRAVAVRAFQRLIVHVESVTFDGDALRAAGHAHDRLTARSRNQAPVGFAGDRVRIETTQVMLWYGKAFVLDEILQRVRVLMTGREVRGDRDPVGMPDEEQLRLTLALLGERPDTRRDRRSTCRSTPAGSRDPAAARSRGHARGCGSSAARRSRAACR